MMQLTQLPFRLFLLTALFALACGVSDEDFSLPNTPDGTSGEWSIPRDQVLDGGPGKDGIPSIDQPQFTPASAVTFLDPGDLVLGIKVGDEVRAYPHPILDWHEIVNDQVANRFVAVTYCPLTGTGVAWSRELTGTVTTFGVSGLLYNSNLIPYDRETDSNWSQILLESVNGELLGQSIETFQLVETTWATWRSWYPESMVLNTNTGFNRDYRRYPYQDYRTNHDRLVAPITPDDGRLPRKERGLGVINNGEAKFYRLASFSGGLAVFQDRFAGTELVLVGSVPQNFLVAYDRRLPDGTLLEMTAVPGGEQAGVMIDQEGNTWTIFGEAIAGPRQGRSLNPVTSFMGYWMAWGAFYPGLEIFTP